MTNLQAAIRNYESLVVGEEASFQRTITEEDVATFADLSGDRNPLHTDDAYGVTTQFAGRIVHGMFLGALASQLVGMQLPGQYALLVKESLEFKKPVMPGDTVVVSGTLVQKSDATKLIRVDIIITVADAIVAQGETIVRLLK